MAIETIETWILVEPLTHPVEFGNMRFASRDYAVVRITDGDGALGVAYGLARGAPVASMVASFGDAVVGRDPEDTERVWNELYARSITSGQRGVALRAISLIDIALWDLRARRAGQPVHGLLGRQASRVRASVGGGYFRERRSREEIAAELAGYVRDGFGIVKIPAGGMPAVDEERWVAMARDAVGPDVDLAIDTHWTWSDVRSARKVLERLEPFGLDWIEDPMWPEAIAAVAELRRHLRTPIAIGDELSGRWAYQQMLEPRAADIWRVDVTTVGGFTEARRVLGMASAWGIPISPHIYPELHVHLAAADASVMCVEYTTPESEIDLSHRFVHGTLSPDRGWFDAPTAPGLGIEVDFERVAATATASWTR
ncbi:MAG: mandelate racemase/muconate lactonizing enzyme family protein [Chloroflexota bacterium]